MFIIYDLIFLILGILYLCSYAIRGKLHKGLWMRFGVFPKDIRNSLESGKNNIWIHAVSVGETVSLKKLIESLREEFKDYRLIISTVTRTGNDIAKSLVKNDELVIFLPFDLSFITRRTVQIIRPKIFILAETEIWPNLITNLSRKHIPIVLINGRISDKSLRGYRIIGLFVKTLFHKISYFCMQTDSDAKRVISLGAPQDKVKTCGNMKFDNSDYGDKKIDYSDNLNLGREEKLWVCGSTHPGEEEVILEAYKRLLKDFTDLRLLIAPRHVERTQNIEGLVKKYGFTPLRISNLNPLTINYKPSTIFILDTMGELRQFYALATMVFVGGSLIRKGGHNIIEPASLGKPVIFGPHMFNFADIAGTFLNKGAAVMVRDKDQLYSSLKGLLDNPDKARLLGEGAKSVCLENQGATGRVLEVIGKQI
ncbi:MAG: 3-deoxy-D-manno-octulosonic acid transferase [Candidatus Omnitrophota bacterium]